MTGLLSKLLAARVLGTARQQASYSDSRRSMQASKTTFYLSNEFRSRLKAVAAQTGKSVKQLLTEGAELVLAQHEMKEDKEKLRLRAAKAWKRVREGLYS